MADQEMEMREEMRTGFRLVVERLAAIETKVDDGFADAQTALHAIMSKLLDASEVEEIRSAMRNPPPYDPSPFVKTPHRMSR